MEKNPDFVYEFNDPVSSTDTSNSERDLAIGYPITNPYQIISN